MNSIVLNGSNLLPENYDSKISELLLSIFFDYNLKVEELVFHFMSDEELLQKNIELLNHNFYTDIITLDESFGGNISTYFLISIDRVFDNAKTHKNSVLEELYRVMIHGCLHVIGFDDKDDRSKSIMREKENYYLNKLSMFHVKHDRDVR